MGLFDSVLGGLLGGGGGGNAGPLQSIMSSLLSGGGQGQQSGQGGIMGLVQQFAQAGHGDVANSWVGTGANQPANPGMLEQVFGADRVNQWAQQTGMAPNDLLAQLSHLLPHAVDHMTPDGQVPASDSASPFDEAGTELPTSRA